MPYKNPEAYAKWYREYKERRNRLYRERYANDPQFRERKRAYMREYQRTIRDLAKTDPEHPKVRKWLERQRRYRKKQWLKEKQALDKLAGDVCSLCGIEYKHQSKRRRFINLHNIHNKKHSKKLAYMLEHKEEFVPLCRLCHDTVHRMNQLFGLTWDDILLLKTRNFRIVVASP